MPSSSSTVQPECIKIIQNTMTFNIDKDGNVEDSMFYIFYIDKSKLLTISKTIDNIFGEVLMTRVVELLKFNKLINGIQISKINSNQICMAEASFIVQGTDCLAIQSVNGKTLPKELSTKVLSIIKDDIEMHKE